METDLIHAVSYFKKYPVYNKLFAAMRKKYASLGHLGGVFILDLSMEERNTLSGFLGLDLGKETTVKLSFSSLEKALKRSRFAACTWEEIIVRHDGKPLFIKKEERQQKRRERELFCESALALCTDENVRAWLSDLLAGQARGSRQISRLLSSDVKAAGDLLKNVVCALEHLPADRKQKQLLPVFAAEITGNPHYFDEGTAAGKLLLNYGYYRFGQTAAGISGIEQRESLLYAMGILKDDLSNVCMVYGVSGTNENNEVHKGLQGFWTERQALQVTLNTLGKLVCLKAAGEHKTKVYVVENPAVFSYLIQKYPDDTFVCTMGQVKLAGYVTLDLFPEHYILFYAGDFDASGLQIAQGLKLRYGSRLVLWNYKKEFYELALSDEVLKDQELRKLDKVTVEELQEIKECLLERKRAAYQENMLGSYVVEQEAE